jgi:hypothetical protein
VSSEVVDSGVAESKDEQISSLGPKNTELLGNKRKFGKERIRGKKENCPW